MPTWLIVLIVAAAVIVLVVIAVLTRRSARTKAGTTAELKGRFGSEYDRLVTAGTRKQAEHELIAREQRHADLGVHGLAEADRSRFAANWQRVQLSFLDDPGAATRDAKGLVDQVMSSRGYPTEDAAEAQAATLSVEHSAQLANLREAQAIQRAAQDGKATTEDLRQAMVRYRALFADLLQASTSHEDDDVYPMGDGQTVRVLPAR